MITKREKGYKATKCVTERLQQKERLHKEREVIRQQKVREREIATENERYVQLSDSKEIENVLKRYSHLVS